MKKKKRIVVVLLSLAIVISTIVLIMLTKSNNQELNINDGNQDIKEESKDNLLILSQEKIDELKQNLGKGKNGDVVDVVEDVDKDNNKTYTYITDTGSSKTITIRKAKEGEQTGLIDVDEDLPFDIEDENQESQQEPENPSDPGQNEPTQEDLGTVYEKFMNMSASEQAAFYKSFENPEDFYVWFDQAEAEYNKLHPQIIVGKDEVIDFGN